MAMPKFKGIKFAYGVWTVSTGNFSMSFRLTERSLSNWNNIGTVIFRRIINLLIINYYNTTSRIRRCISYRYDKSTVLIETSVVVIIYYCCVCVCVHLYLFNDNVY